MSASKLLLLGILLFLLAGCFAIAPLEDLSLLYGPAAPRDRVLTPAQEQERLAAGQVSFARDVQPILAQRCVVCHGCYDAPCQLKLESGAALDRGATKKPVYDGGRLEPAKPTRMGVDGKTTADWRAQGFYPVLNERRQVPLVNVEDSVLAQMLLLKKEYPLPTAGVLPESFDFALDRELSCPKREEFGRFAARHPDWGMPYGLPGLKPEEHDTILAWLKEGARYPEPPELSKKTRAAVDRVEAFLNGPDLKHRLMARYIYEHLFMGHLHLEGTGEEFFRLVRSRTPSGQPVDEIATVRPYGDPGPGPLYYRLKPFQQVIVDKNHMVYEIGPNRLQRWQALFLDPVYSVPGWPGYAPATAANPFVAFAALPPGSRYRFLLDDAGFFIAGFMKGPVCRGQVALNVIRDRFWVVFYDPGADPLSTDAGFLAQQAGNLRLPTEQESEIGIDDLMFTYDNLEKDYLKAKNGFLAGRPDNARNSLAAIWDGDGRNPEAALTVFRHFDSASLSRGFVGAAPLTAWALDYPLMERIHYLLVAGFNVFGSVKHQAATRLFMDHLRNEAENNFLSFLPARVRPDEYRLWYRGVLARMWAAVDNPYYGYGKDTAIDFKTATPKAELFGLIRGRLGAMAGPPDLLNDCRGGDCDRPGASALERQAERALRPLAALRGGGIQYLPELAYLRVRGAGAEAAVYSLAKNEALKNVAFMFREQSRRLPEEDTLTVVPGFVGSYPNFFYDLTIDRLPDFVAALAGLRSPEGMTALAERYGVRRSNPGFWAVSDWFNARHRRDQPVEAGLFDLNRYDNL